MASLDGISMGRLERRSYHDNGEVMFIKKKEYEAAYVLTPTREFFDTEFPAHPNVVEAIAEKMADYEEIQAYLQKVYILCTQGAYKAAANTEIPKCLGTASVARKPKEKATEAASSLTSQKPSPETESSSSSNQKTE